MEESISIFYLIYSGAKKTLCEIGLKNGLLEKNMHFIFLFYYKLYGSTFFKIYFNGVIIQMALWLLLLTGGKEKTGII